MSFGDVVPARYLQSSSALQGAGPFWNQRTGFLFVGRNGSEKLHSEKFEQVSTPMKLLKRWSQIYLQDLDGPARARAGGRFTQRLYTRHVSPSAEHDIQTKHEAMTSSGRSRQRACTHSLHHAPPAMIPRRHLQCTLVVQAIVTTHVRHTHQTTETKRNARRRTQHAIRAFRHPRSRFSAHSALCAVVEKAWQRRHGRGMAEVRHGASSGVDRPTGRNAGAGSRSRPSARRGAPPPSAARPGGSRSIPSTAPGSPPCR